jgi:NTE family protein
MDKINVVLSGSGIRFPYFIGALKYLLRRYEINAIAGTSGGSLVSGLVASGMNIKELELFCTDFNFKQILKHNCFLIQTPELFRWSEEKFIKILNEYSVNPYSNISNLPIKLRITASDISTMSMKVFENEMLFKSILASMALPLLISPVEINNKYYVDGGLTANFNINVWKDSPYKTIGINLRSLDKINKPTTISGYLDRVLDTMLRSQENYSELISDLYKENFEVISIDTTYSSFDLSTTKEDSKAMIDSAYKQICNHYKSK